MGNELKRGPGTGKGRLTHGHARHNVGDSPTYQSWTSMKSRCNLTERENSGRYKDRGITYCERWESFENFLFDMGERPPGTSIDRWPDFNGNYAPGNCRWATPREQARNTRRSKLTLETATQVAFLMLSGAKASEVAKQFGVCESLPREIIRGSCWPDALQAAKSLPAAPSAEVKHVDTGERKA